MKDVASINPNRISRRDFLKVAGGLGLTAVSMTLLEACGVKPATPIPENAPLETTTITLSEIPSICFAPQYLAQDMLHQEGFTDIQYIKENAITGIDDMISGAMDMSMGFSGPLLIRLDKTDALVMLAGVHVGCFVLFGSKQVNTILDLRGKSVGITDFGTSEHSFVSILAAYVGLDPNKDINWAIHPLAESKQLFMDGKLDAFLAFPPIAQELRTKKIGHEVLNSMMDKPWSGYYCCMIIGNRDFVQKNPVATKGVVRSILKAADICAKEPERAARFIVDKGYATNYDYALAALKEIPYGVWRTYDPDDTLRFYALQLHAAGMIKTTPDEIIANGTDWRFLNELKNELKG